jgi:DNA-binding NarL/FixJ family response regulator
MSKTRIMLADDHAVVRSGLRRLLEQNPDMEVVVEAENGEGAYQLFSEHLPDVAVLDLSMPGMGGLEAVRRILARHSAARLLVFSMHENASFAAQVLKAGARGYVSKTGAPDELLIAVQEVLRGKTYLSPTVAQKIAMHSLVGEDGPIHQLSAREFEVFRLLAEGRTTDEIGEVLKISQKTVANYHTLIKQKLGINTSVELIRLAMRHGIIRE